MKSLFTLFLIAICAVSCMIPRDRYTVVSGRILGDDSTTPLKNQAFCISYENWYNYNHKDVQKADFTTDNDGRFSVMFNFRTTYTAYIGKKTGDMVIRVNKKGDGNLDIGDVYYITK